MKHFYKKGLITVVILMSAFCMLAQAPLAQGQSKFLGCAWSNVQNTDFAKYFNQVTPENGGKWGSVEGNRNSMSWTDLTNAYNLAKSKGYLFKNHTMIWGNQQPTWIENLDTATQRKEIEQWFSLTAQRFPAIDMIDVVNEPLHAPPSGPGHGNYWRALGAGGSTGWDWVIRSFRMGRRYFPNAKLLINEYNIVNSAQKTADYRKIIELLVADSLIDGIGIQCHAFSTFNVSSDVIKKNLDSLAATGLPIYVSELDIDGPNDLQQLREYQRLFPIFWNHPAVAGITLWGFRPGLWRNTEKAYLVNSNGTDRPAFKWLKAYVNDTLTLSQSVNISSLKDTIYVGETLQMKADILPANTTIKNLSWSVSSATLATISTSGLLTPLTAGKVTVRVSTWDNSRASSKAIQILNRLVESVTISATGNVDSVAVNETLQLQANVLPVNATNKLVTWKTIQQDVAGIDANGLLSPKTNGFVDVVATAKDGSGFSDTIRVMITDAVTGLPDDALINIRIYPNPAISGKFNIDGLDGKTRVVVSDIYGRKIREIMPGEKSLQMQLNVPTGIYLLQFSDGLKSSMQKISVRN